MFIKFATSKIKASGNIQYILDTFYKGKEDIVIKKIAATVPIAFYSPKYLYAISEAIHSKASHGYNENFDAFPKDELLKSYPTFICAGVYRDHQNDDISKAIGICPDAYPTIDKTAIDVLMAMNKRKAPDVIDGVESGEIDSTSMGVVVQEAQCSICKNVAHTEEEFCNHIKNGMKGQYIDGEMCYEDNFGLNFFENTIISAFNTAADPHAKIKTILAAKNNIKSKRDFEISESELNQTLNQLNQIIAKLEKGLNV